MSNKHMIDDLDVVLGQCIRVKNVEKEQSPKAHHMECDTYVAIQVEDYSGKKEYCILLTHINHTDMESVQFPMDIVNKMIAGRLYPCKIAKRDTYLLKVIHWDGRSYVIRMSPSQLEDAIHRAECHPFSCTTKSLLTDLFD